MPPRRTDATGTPLVQTWPEVHYLLSHATQKLSLQDMLHHWPVEEERPERSTLSRWLQRATEQRLICRSGTGLRGNGYRYWLPGQESLLWPGENASEADKQAWKEQCYAHFRLGEQGGFRVNG